MTVYQIPFTRIHVFNILAQFAFDYLLVRYVGPSALGYLISSSFLAGSLHPCAGHFIAEHYVLNKPAAPTQKSLSLAPVPETFSYYGSLNLLTYNVGFHNEHHDFPAVAWTRLPTLHRIAKEFYVDLPSHQSWIWVIWQFICDEQVGLWCRVKRKEGGRKVGGWREDELGCNERQGAKIPGVR